MRSRTAGSLLDLVGDTPLVELRRLAPKPSVRLFAKLEGQNPTGSIKDRVALAMIEAAEAAGELEPGRELLEPTSGNTGIALALVAKLKGYSLTCVLPENATEERRRLLRLYGARIVESPGEEGSNGAVRLSLELAEREPRYFMPFQYANEANPRAHFEGTGAEIAGALDRVDVLAAGHGGEQDHGRAPLDGRVEAVQHAHVLALDVHVDERRDLVVADELSAERREAVHEVIEELADVRAIGGNLARAADLLAQHRGDADFAHA